uniref:Uncharacterized protein n=2 Tax=Strombidium inclinatum TaxID=197538 RepID=A0A7S3MZH7_9SPIT|mmetsp:Transcript_32256/g.49377  ORF Transcript_32256/g.49377 Transcript_32256/m.49377 type:complete len:180 (+) Transcript_32256:190-729(+)|eukprot:CAMPEP_0170478872 /NCGR_PEP_ID=MMETSP0208-20121228/309_1 /TAXON_ID=197538 /ORGANISM="Strombidium inclinatum, Strain S3" /LENGTH=179 /DNA_ID=CAMNT_0010751201 /DNA_START=197 /DNA_END=736 /DNA_ORIENTATION=+
MAMNGAKTCPSYAYIFETYSDYLTDFQISYAFQELALDKVERTPEFWNVILPKVKEQVPTLDRQCTQSLHGIIAGAGLMQLQDNVLWEALESKLVDEGLLRYFNVQEAAEILYYFAQCGRGSDELIDQMEKTFIQNKKALVGMDDTLWYLREGFSQLNKGSEILKKVLEDPEVELPKLE